MITGLILGAIVGFSVATIVWPPVIRRNLKSHYTDPIDIEALENGWVDEELDGRVPDFVIGPINDPYLLRWWVIPRNRIFNIYRHRIRRDDDDRALHDHPWPSISIVTKGKLIEHREGKPPRRLKRFVPYLRRANALHRLEVGSPRDQDAAPADVRTIFITGLKIREWGFACPNGRWVPWQHFTSANNPGEIGRGCGE